MSLPSQVMPPRLGRQADDGAQRAGLADAVAAEHAGDLADERRSSDTSRRAWLAP